MSNVSACRRIETCLLVLVIAQPLSAELISVEVQQREPVDEGRRFGVVGPCERIQGVMRFAVDPAAPENQAIVDIKHAPVNDRGLVEFESDFVLIRPVDPSRGNGALLFNVANRGGVGWHFGNPNFTERGHVFPLERGFTLLAIGWQHDVGGRAPDQTVVRCRVPVASQGGEPIRGLVAVSFMPAEVEEFHRLSARGHLPYKVADPEAAGTRMTIRHLDGREETVPRENWRFDGEIVSVDGGFQPGRTYEVVYQAQNPAVTGLGYAAVRDGVSAVERGGIAELGLEPGVLNRSMAYGLSQSGRFLRGFVHEGFNRDSNGERVFEGVLACIAGAHRMATNYRFAQPSDNPGLLFPFTDGEQTDAETGDTGGLLSDLPPDSVPKMMYLNTSNEYWRNKCGALVHTRVDGSGDFPLPETTRLYVVAGTQHAPAAGTWWEHEPYEQPRNPLNYFPMHRALLMALDRWIEGDGDPPASRYPRLDKNELVTSEEFEFAKIPGVTVPPSGQLTARAIIGPDFHTEGPITIRPTRTGTNYPHWVCRVDDDGNEIGGIRLPELAVPLGTYTGWNQVFPGATDMWASLRLQGSFIPFARDEKEREANGDPRPSLAARYRDLEDYMGQMSIALLECAKEGYILKEDVDPMLRAARFRYENLYVER